MVSETPGPPDIEAWWLFLFADHHFQDCIWTEEVDDRAYLDIPPAITMAFPERSWMSLSGLNFLVENFLDSVNRRDTEGKFDNVRQIGWNRAVMTYKEQLSSPDGKLIITIALAIWLIDIWEQNLSMGRSLGCCRISDQSFSRISLPAFGRGGSKHEPKWYPDVLDITWKAT
jgi:hypothetical protein